ncbi:MAG: hypothetical protein ABSE73_17770 [Planctomycetota bacterium]
MSFSVLIIPEDPTHNGYILKPLVERMMRELGKPQARVKVLENPKLNGYDDALRAIEEDLPLRYKHFDLWLFLPDADKAKNLAGLERELEAQGICLRCCAAKPEVEAWLLAGHREKLNLDWKHVRKHARLKEMVFATFLEKYGDARAPGGGRSALMEATLRGYDGLLTACDELKGLQERLKQLPALSGQP